MRGALDGNLLPKCSKALSFDPGECITALFSEVDEQMDAIPTHPEAYLWPSESVLVYDSIIAQVTDNMLNEVQG